MQMCPRDSAGAAAVLVKMVRGKARDSSCAGKNGARESAGQRGTADVLLKMGRGKARDSAGQQMCCKNGMRESAGQQMCW